DGMKVRFRRAVALGVAITAVAAIAAAYLVSVSGAAPKKAYNIAVLYYNGSPYGISQLKGAQQEAKRLGSSVTGFNANNDPHLQQTQLQDAITTGKYPGMIVAALDGHGLAP